jgi:CRISPR/Cas system-associated exonuclease Cas4 (RecB family)
MTNDLPHLPHLPQLPITDYLTCEHMSVSRRQLWSDCQNAYKFRYHLKIIPDEPVKPYFVYGKVIHKIIEEYTREQGKRAIESIAADVLNGKIETEPGAGVPFLEPDYQKKLAGHLRNLKTLTDKIGYDGYLEWKFHYDIQPPDKHFITGFIDRLIIRGDKYFILDYKTTKKGFWRKNANTIRKDLQLRCYARVVQKEFGAKAENIRAALYYVDSGNGDLISTRFSEESLITAEQELHDAYKEITSTKPEDVYGRVNDQCKRCSYRKICSFYSLL